ncbi:MAG TPA: 4Fe-4S ferredoxin [Bacteroidales bacterium]|nr:MAG: hypothetical protein A2W98_01310 [Bacteroidetes bacterium GWF2_33_38]OFY75175.1 MAG: hypothetical protein A2265_05170 [Bacteroidetes bacterium RIFOXYA12_FULL_33_9]OFY88969.1 MAG: hypothetical protein A2236_04250 [Bacteroidetes bacterium RIFOXYA2_FULL_33_7]HBF88975.1 4Fe-4S ferredoxin [Bacteroidales bacterium]
MKEFFVNENYCPKSHHCPTLSVCPSGAIIQDSPYSAPKIDNEKCTKCGKCVRTCPAFQCSGC